MTGVSGSRAPGVRTALKRVQLLFSHVTKPTATRKPLIVGKQLSTELRWSEERAIDVFADEVAALDAAEHAITADLRYEHLGDQVKATVWTFASTCYLEPDIDHVPHWIKENGHDLIEVTCFVPVEHLGVSSPTTACGLQLLPVTDPSVPRERVRFFFLGAPVASVAAVNVVGTNYGLMADRARPYARHRLRILRIALRAHFGIHDRQLRFRLGETYSFGEGASGWADRGEEAYPLGLDETLVDFAHSQPITALLASPENDVQSKAELATRWMERAWFSTEPLVALLYLFFAMEALIGDASSGEKGRLLAFRQALLAAAVGDGFANPNETFFLYDQVRSAAVHGEETVDVSWATVSSFSTTVQWSLNSYLRYASKTGLQRRGKLMTTLTNEPEEQKLVEWLHKHGGDAWADFGQPSASPSKPTSGE